MTMRLISIIKKTIVVNTLAQALIFIGMFLAFAGAVGTQVPPEKPPPSVYRTVTPEEDRNWQIKQLSDLIDAQREADGYSPTP
jgi:hypothetical protein